MLITINTPVNSVHVNGDQDLNLGVARATQMIVISHCEKVKVYVLHKAFQHQSLSIFYLFHLELRKKKRGLNEITNKNFQIFHFLLSLMENRTESNE